MTDDDAKKAHVEAAKAGEHLQREGEPDPFPPEGTDEKVVQSQSNAEVPLSDDEATKAAQGVIARGLSGKGSTRADWSNGEPPADAKPADG